MPKMKTHSGAKARFKVTRTGKVLRKKHGSSHLRLAKAKRTKRQYHGKLNVDSGDKPRLAKLLPYGTP